jgi:hypothetical protein
MASKYYLTLLFSKDIYLLEMMNANRQEAFF